MTDNKTTTTLEAPKEGRGVHVTERAALEIERVIEEQELDLDSEAQEDDLDLDHVRPDLAEVHERHAVTLDEARPDAVAKRRKTNQRTARENIYAETRTPTDRGLIQEVLDDFIERRRSYGCLWANRYVGTNVNEVVRDESRSKGIIREAN